jgi:hypothetical protein
VSFGLNDRTGNLAADRGDFALQISDAGFAGIVPDDRPDAVVSELEVLLRYAVRFKFLGDEETFRDFQFFLLCVTRQAEQFHSVL